MKNSKVIICKKIISIFIISNIMVIETIAVFPKTNRIQRISRNEGKEYSSVQYVPDLPEQIVQKLLADYRAGRNNEDINLNITQLIQKYGYATETHRVQTPDGYILTMFRIPNKGPPVFLMHGLIGSADDYITSGPNTSLGYLLAAAGYDVWLGNARGNKHSRMHVRYSPNTDLEQFWNFSWDEIGRLDLPTMIDYVLHITRRQQLVYIGHSQGTTSFFVMSSTRPEYNQKIALMIALSPVAWMSHLASPPIRMLSNFYDGIETILHEWIGIYEMFPNVASMRSILNESCAKNPQAELYCHNIIFIFCGFNYAQINASNLHVFISHIPGGASTKQFMHYAQEIRSGKFRRYDYGEEMNIKIYGQKYPPNYPVERISCPVAIYYGDGDWLASLIDIDILRKKLTNVIDDYLVPFHGFNHVDFIIGKDAKSLIFMRVLRDIKAVNYS